MNESDTKRYSTRNVDFIENVTTTTKQQQHLFVMQLRYRNMSSKRFKYNIYFNSMLINSNHKIMRLT